MSKAGHSSPGLLSHRLDRRPVSLLAVVVEEVGFHSQVVRVARSPLADQLEDRSFRVEPPSTARTRSVAVVARSDQDLQVHRALQAQALQAHLAQAGLRVELEVEAASRARTSAGYRHRRGLQRHLALLATSPSRSGCGA